MSHPDYTKVPTMGQQGPKHNRQPRSHSKDGERNKQFVRQKSGRESRPRPSSISDLQYSLESSPTSSSTQSKSSTGSDTSSPQAESDLLDQSCSSISSGLPDPVEEGGQIPVWRRNGKFVAFFRSFMGPREKGKEKERKKVAVFGAELSRLLADTGDDVPQVVRICTQFIEEHGVINGIYRASGISSNIQRIKTMFDEQRVPSLAGDPAVVHDIHSISSVLKLYFRMLPTPLVTYDLYPHLVLASKQTEARRGEKFREILQRLPPSHYRTMDWLMRHLFRMSQQSDRTGMTSKNLAIVWSPNILRCDVSELDTQDALQDVGLQAVITEFLIRCSTSVFSAVPAAPPAGHCVHCCCQCSNGTTGNKEQAAPNTKETGTGNNNNNHSVTFAKSPQSAATISSQYNLGSSLLKPALKTTDSVAGGQDIELRLDRPTRPRPRSVAVPNPATYLGEGEVRLVSLPSSQTAQLVDVSVNRQPVVVADKVAPCEGGHGAWGSSDGGRDGHIPSDVGKGAQVTFHTVLDKPSTGERRADQGGKVGKKVGAQGWRNIFNIGGQSQTRQRGHTGDPRVLLRGSHREINIDDAILPENKPINYRPRPRSEINLAYSIQDSTLMLTPLKNNEFQVTTTNQFSYLPYQQHLLNYNNVKQPFARTSKLRQNLGGRSGPGGRPVGGTQASMGGQQRPKSVDFEVMQSVENICRAQPLAYSAGGPHGEIRASQRVKGGGLEHNHSATGGDRHGVAATRV